MADDFVHPVGSEDPRIYDNTVQLGDFAFDLTPGLPAGDALVSVEVKTRLSGTTTESAAMIESGSVTVVGNVVSFKCRYPGTGYIGHHEVLFRYTLASGAEGTLVFKHFEIMTP